MSDNLVPSRFLSLKCLSYAALRDNLCLPSKSVDFFSLSWLDTLRVSVVSLKVAALVLHLGNKHYSKTPCYLPFFLVMTIMIIERFAGDGKLGEFCL